MDSEIEIREMKRYIFIIILSLALITFFAGCESISASKDNSQNIKSTEGSVLTLEDIEEKYKTENLGEIVEISNFGGNYVIVEYLPGGDGHWFDLYNLKTGDRDIMPLDCPNASLHSFGSNPDGVIFEADGVSPGNGHKYFPYYIICTRAEEVTGSEHDFHMQTRDLYKPIDEGLEFGVKSNEMIKDLKGTLSGFELQFAPQEGKEAEFYAGYATIPVMKTSYNSSKNQFMIELISTTVSIDLLKKPFNEQNMYIDSIEMKESGSNTLILVNLKDNVKFYNAKHDQDEFGNFPSVRFTFRNSSGM